MHVSFSGCRGINLQQGHRVSGSRGGRWGTGILSHIMGVGGDDEDGMGGVQLQLSYLLVLKEVGFPSFWVGTPSLI